MLHKCKISEFSLIATDIQIPIVIIVIRTQVVSDNTDHTDVSDIPKPLDFANMLSKQLDKIITSLSLEDLEATLSTLRKIFDNIIQHPNDDKYYQIELANKTFSVKCV